MIWALIFTVLFSVMGNSPLLLPNSKKLVKKHVVDKEKQAKLLELIKDAKTERKSFAKVDKKLSKEFNKLYQARDTKRAELDDLLVRFITSRKEMQAASLSLIYESQNLISEKEWAKLKPDYREGLEKLDKKSKKEAKQVRKGFDKLENSIENFVDDNSKKELIILALNNFETTLFDLFATYRKVMLDENSIVYQYHIEKQQLIDMQKEHSKNLEDLLIAYTNLHFVAVENTNEQEWGKIKSKLKLPI